MNPPESDDPLDALLREQKYIEDNGFTARVMMSLPRRRSWHWVRPTLLLGSTVIGSLLAAAWLPWAKLNPAALLSLNSQALSAWLVVLLVTGAFVWSIVATLQWEE